jgi:hypothetical protein
MIRRIGQFFFLVGLILVALFYLSDVAQMPQYALLLWAALVFLLSFFFLRRGRKQREDSMRFRTLRKLRGRGKKEEGEEHKQA